MIQTTDTARRPIAIIGLGTIGLSWAVLFAARDYPVRAFDSHDLARAGARDGLLERLRQLEQFGLLDSVDRALSHVTICTQLEDTVSGVHHVQEAVIEDRTVKTRLFADIGILAPEDAVIASSASELPGSALFGDMKGRERGIVAHPINPPHLVPLVELCPSPWTAEWVVERSRSLMIDVGQSPIVLRRELFGFIANRLQMALVGEAMRLVSEGWCSPSDADSAVRDGIGLRWAFMGPFETGHLNAPGGASEYYRKFRNPIRKLMAAARPDCEYTDELIDEIHREIETATPNQTVAERRAWRDGRLAALRKHLSTPFKDDK